MDRLHLVELEDLSFVPAALRDGGTDLLDLGFDRMGFYDGAAPKLVEALRRTGAQRVVDLCSGGGGGTLQMRRHVRAAGLDVEYVLSDLHPNEAARARVEALGDARTRYRAEPLDAMSGGGDDAGLRTMSGALHHFRPEAVRALLASLVARGHSLAFFDVAASPALRAMPAALAPLAMGVNMAALALGSLVAMPFVRPVRASNLALTYALPAIPLLVAWDGTVSALRAYAPDELLALAREVPGADRYDWDAGVAGRALWLTGLAR